MTGWHRRALALFDTETTGIDTEQDRIVTACVAVVDTSETPPFQQTVTWLADPGIDIPAEAAAVHGISTDHARAHGRPLPEVVREVLDELLLHVRAGHPIVGHNIAYDFTLLHRNTLRCGMAWPDDLRDRLIAIDTLVLDKAGDQYRRGSRKLADTAAHYGVKIGTEHSADGDAFTAGRIAYAIAHRYPGLAALDPADLHARQVGWRRQQCESFQNYKRRTDPNIVIDPCWPVCYGHGGAP